MACSCANNAIGIWVCDGTGNCVVLTPPATGGPWFPVRDTTNNTWTWSNLGDIIDEPGEGLRADKKPAAVGEPKPKPRTKSKK